MDWRRNHEGNIKSLEIIANIDMLYQNIRNAANGTQFDYIWHLCQKSKDTEWHVALCQVTRKQNQVK